ncbi:MAG: response regulator [Chloroflexi bacterium]|nr:response regulator [Chloroflexota bacterium]
MAFAYPILVVEDEPDGRELVSRILKVAAVQVELAEDGEQAWDMLQTAMYSAAVIDLALPGMDGMQLLGYIRDDPRLAHLPCVAITAYHTPELKQRALQQGFDGYFPKPLDRTIFLNALNSIVEPD